MEASVSEQIVKVLTAAHQLALQRRYQAAGQLLSKAAVLLPMDTEVHLCLARMLLEAGNHVDAEQASTLAIASSADTAKTGHGHALRANVRWCQGNLLGAYEDLHIAQQAMQTINSSYAINMSEDLEWLAMQVAADSQSSDGSHHTQEDEELATLEDVGKVAQAEAQEMAKLSMQAADTQNVPGCKTGSGDASANLDDDKVASAEPDKAFMTQATAITEPPIPYALQASDSTARSKVCGQTNIASAAQGGSAGTLPKRAEGLSSIADLPVPAGTPSPQTLQPLSHSTPASIAHPHTVPTDHAADASTSPSAANGSVSPTVANGTSCSGSTSTAEFVASTSAAQRESDEAVVESQRTRNQHAERSDAATDNVGSEGLKPVSNRSPKDTAERGSITCVWESPGDAKGALQGRQIPPADSKTAARCRLWRNTAVGVSLALGCAAALALCRMKAKQRS